jgi:RHS repeat-associated protein
VTILTGLGNGRNINFARGKKVFELTNHLGNVLATVSDKKMGVSANSATIDSYNPVMLSAQEYYPFGMLMPGRGGHIGAGRNELGFTVVMNGDTVPSTLTVSQRAASLPATYTATQVISFEPGFETTDGDQFTTMFVDQTSADPGTESGVSYGIDGKGYRYGFNGQERSDEIKGQGNSYTATFWEYDARIGRRWNVDPVFKSDISSYATFSGNPISRIDPSGDDDFFDNRGNYIGSTSEGSMIRIINEGVTLKEAMKRMETSTKLLTDFRYSKYQEENLSMLAAVATYYGNQAEIKQEVTGKEVSANQGEGAFAFYDPSTNSFHLAINYYTSKINSLANDKYLMINSLVHEKKHQDDPSTWKPLNHVDAVLTQVEHSSFEKTQRSAKQAMGSYVAVLLTESLQKGHDKLEDVKAKIDKVMESKLSKYVTIIYDEGTNSVTSIPSIEGIEIKAKNRTKSN